MSYSDYITALIILILIYFGATIIELDFSVLNWSLETRKTVVVFFMISLVVLKIVSLFVED